MIEALRINPDKYTIINNGKYDDNNVSLNEAEEFTESHSKLAYSNYYYNEYQKGILELIESIMQLTLKLLPLPSRELHSS